MKCWMVCLILVSCVLAGGCIRTAESGAGFRLPDGDADQGQQAFVDLHCNGCHQVRGLDIPFAGLKPTAPVVLGGEVSRVKTYGDLVTSIINPSHKLAPSYPKELSSVDGESIMANAQLNSTMTVQQLVDLVAFLQPQYNVRVPQGYPYVYQFGTQ